ncbi:hypothetical protein IE81DRAFT_23986 [Ceraceosorus guamensis]|uniref:Peptidase C15, pyroglutamyl peptidase I-like protein n=1 Tax=Ceraceosorus guamensis TaxID=1522189 RepID=A0A316VQF1_9BASI|nr:hypothetical protein IE81DRAFT_23986 [Ceraceosorus guamensis]PWN39474.1 hypothetical protein IE81DRAFT_23986 [Ceraceosorus guamensis]
MDHAQPFGSIGKDANPSWLAIKELNNTYLSLSEPPGTGDEAGSSSSSSAPIESGPRIHIQVLQSATVYAHVLSLVPRIHGNPPSAHSEPYMDPSGAPAPDDEGPQGIGEPYPIGYTLRHPERGYDFVLHLGVGYPGGLAVEKAAHKRRYQITDAKGEFAPRATDQSDVASELSKAEERERERLQRAAERALKEQQARAAESNGQEKSSSSPPPPTNLEEEAIASFGPRLCRTAAQPPPPPKRLFDHACLRGFAEGYEQFKDVEETNVDTDGLAKFLSARGTPVRESDDAGRFLCDFIYYASLTEFQRAAHRLEGVAGARRDADDEADQQQKASPITPLFVHVPPEGQDLTLEQVRKGILDVVWWSIVGERAR